MSTNESGGSERFSTDASKAMTAAPAFFRIADVMRITALSRATVYRRIADGIFPAPVHLGGRACGWTPAALQAWIHDPGGYRVPSRSYGQDAGSQTQPSESLARAGRSQRQGGNQPSARIASIRAPSLPQASRFSSVCRVFAPVYRQITVAGLGDITHARDVGFPLAYGDVRAAWRDYLAHDVVARAVQQLVPA